jgi:hypothetical protein
VALDAKEAQLVTAEARARQQASSVVTRMKDIEQADRLKWHAETNALVKLVRSYKTSERAAGETAQLRQGLHSVWYGTPYGKVLRKRRAEIARQKARALKKLETLRQALTKAEAQAARQQVVEQRRTEALAKARALAAAHLGKTRDLGSRVKERIASSQTCPYCGSALGADVATDHIYPVARGGLSHPSNMVKVCAACNRKKAGRTLREFIQKFSLNRDTIERALDALKKSY